MCSSILLSGFFSASFAQRHWLSEILLPHPLRLDSRHLPAARATMPSPRLPAWLQLLGVIFALLLSAVQGQSATGTPTPTATRTGTATSTMAPSPSSSPTPTGTVTPTPAFAPCTITTVAGNGVASSLAGVGTAASTGSSFAGASDVSSQRYYFGTSNVIMRLDMASQAVAIVAGTGGLGSVDGVGTSASVGSIYGMVFAPTGLLYFSDTSSYKVRSFNTITSAVVTLAGTGASANLDGTGTAAAFRSPRGIALDATGSNLIIVRPPCQPLDEQQHGFSLLNHSSLTPLLPCTHHFSLTRTPYLHRLTRPTTVCAN